MRPCRDAAIARSPRRHAAACARARTRRRSPPRRAAISSFVSAREQREDARTGRAGPRRGTRTRRAGAGSASATGWNSFSVEPRRRRVEQVREREAERGALASARCLRASQNTGSAPSATAIAWTTRSSSGLGQIHQSGAKTSEDRVDVRRRAARSARRAGSSLERMAVRRRPDRLHHVPEVEPAGRERAVAEDRERREPGGVRGDRRPERARAASGKPAHASRSMSSRHRPPRTSSLARCSYAARPPAPIRCASSVVGRQPPRSASRERVRHRRAGRAARSRRRRAARARPACRR